MAACSPLFDSLGNIRCPLGRIVCVGTGVSARALSLETLCSGRLPLVFTGMDKRLAWDGVSLVDIVFGIVGLASAYSTAESYRGVWLFGRTGLHGLFAE